MTAFKYVKLAMLVTFVAIVVLSAGTAAAQQFSGVTGIVSDPAGGSISGGQVVLDNAARGFHETTTTNELGIYQFSHVPPADGYQLTFTKDGFRKSVVSGVTLAVSTTETRNIKLELGDTTQSVEVRANGEETINTSDAAIGSDIDTGRLRDLPSQARLNPAALLALQPGVLPNTDEAENAVGSITGSRVDQTTITLDGLDVSDNNIGQAFVMVGNAPIDSIQEFRTVTANAGADAGRAGGGQIMLVTKGGSNDWHGSVREYHRNTIATANSFFNNKDGIAKPPLIRNQFGGNLGGKILRDKLFFFANYDGLRQAASAQTLAIIPLPSFIQGEIRYNNNTGGVSTLTAAQVAQHDPQGIGASPAILQLFNQRYNFNGSPGIVASRGDGLNTTGLRFNSPARQTENDYVARIDYIISGNHKLFLRGNLARGVTDDSGNSVIRQFPNDPAPVATQSVHDYTYVIGYTWNISSNKINQAGFGVANNYLAFPVLFQPTQPNYFTFNGFLSSPYPNFGNAQARKVVTPTFHDEFTYIRGKHVMQFGGSFKPVRDHETQIIDLNTIFIGLGGNTPSLDVTPPSGPNPPPNPLRPADLAGDQNSIILYDTAFTALLGRIANVSAVFDYSRNGTPLPNMTGTRRIYANNEYETFAQDVWRVRSDLTLTFGLRWEYHAVPYEANGLEALGNQNIDQLFATRVQNAANGISGNSAEPFVTFDLAGKVNNKPGYYNPDYKNFDPRLGIAYSPSFSHGLLGNIFGNRKTSLRLGGGVVHDRVHSTVNFITNQASFLFESTGNTNYGVPGDPVGSFPSSDQNPRFTDFSTLPVGVPTAPASTRPVTPCVTSSGFPFGSITNGCSFAGFDQNFKTPYEYTFSFGVQRELPHGFIVDANYVGRLGRKLVAQGDVAQVLNFKDPKSGQLLRTAFGMLERQVQTGATITPQPWFENVMGDFLASRGHSCTEFDSSCTQLVGDLSTGLVTVGDISDTIQSLVRGFSGVRLLPMNVGLSGQVPYNAVLGNFASSNYNALLLSVRKNLRNNLQFDFDYTYSHSIDNFSTNNRQIFGGQQICDLTDLRACRGSSDFDARHLISANWIYNLPVGRGQYFGHDMSRLLDAVVGGWEVAGIYSWHTGLPFNLNTNSFPIGFTNDSPPIVTGPLSALAISVHADPTTGTIQLFKDPNAAWAALSNPFDGRVGNRNSVRGPGFTNTDLGILKNFKMPWKESHQLQFRADMFNAFNQVSFAPPTSGNINGARSQFGVILGTVNPARVIQFALRYDF